MQRILTLHRGVIRNIKRSLSSAQETLSGTLRDSANEITDALLDLLGYATIRTLDGKLWYLLLESIFYKDYTKKKKKELYYT